MNLSILKSDKKNLNSFIAAGSALIFIGFIDIILSSFFSTNITAFLPNKISYLTLFAFSTENWKRPQKEINYLFNLLENFLSNRISDLNKQNIKQP